MPAALLEYVTPILTSNSPHTQIPQTGEAEQSSSVWLWTLILCLSIKESVAHGWLSAWGQPQCKNSEWVNSGNRDSQCVHKRSSSRDEQTVLLRFSSPCHSLHAAEGFFFKTSDLTKLHSQAENPSLTSHCPLAKAGRSYRGLQGSTCTSACLLLQALSSHAELLELLLPSGLCIHWSFLLESPFLS